MPPARRLAPLFALLALAALVGGAWAASQFRAATHGRPWFVRPAGLAAAPDGTLFVGVNRSEVQVYAPDGRPLRAWRVETPGPFRLRAVGERVELVFEDDRIESYGAEGRRVETRLEPGAYAAIGAEGEREARAGDARYALTPRGLVRRAPAPETLLVPAPPPPLAWFGARPLVPVSALLLAAPAGLAACLALSRMRPHDRRSQPVSPN
jgi:hypothetical protein